MKLRDLMAALCAAVLFLILLFALKWNPVVAAILSAGVYFALSFLLTPRRKIGGVDVETMKNGAFVEKTFDEAQEDMRAIDKAVQVISDYQISQDSMQLADTGRRIIQYLEHHVDKIGQAQRFLNYYLDTAGDILTRYVAFQKSGAPDQDMEKVTSSTRSAMKTLNETFSRQYSRLLQGEVMNMEVDVDVLNQMARTDLGGVELKMPDKAGQKEMEAPGGSQR